jgi:hypothetical protein
VNYSGSGLGLSANGDGIRLWNSFVTDPSRLAASVDFGIATSGISFNYNPPTEVFGALSQLGINGVIRALSGLDLGSPGRILGPASPPVLTVSLPAPGTVRIGYSAQAGRSYHLETRASLTSGNWMATANAVYATNQAAAFFELDTSLQRRFFQVRIE